MSFLTRFRKPKYYGLDKKNNTSIPLGLWKKCDQCDQLIFYKEWLENLKVCPRCQYHFRLSARERLSLVLDEDSFQEENASLCFKDPLHFKDSQRYTHRLKEAQKNSGLREALITGRGEIGGRQVMVAALDFNFMGGSMGLAVGEKFTKCIEQAIKLRRPQVVFSASGGARMQEGLLSLMQMAKTSASISLLEAERILYISVLTDPTTGGVVASFASLGDIIIAEKGALIGFAGPRVIEQTIGQKLPEGFQKAESLLKHGMVDLLVERKDLRPLLIKILEFYN